MNIMNMQGKPKLACSAIGWVTATCNKVLILIIYEIKLLYGLFYGEGMDQNAQVSFFH